MPVCTQIVIVFRLKEAIFCWKTVSVSSCDFLVPSRAFDTLHVSLRLALLTLHVFPPLYHRVTCYRSYALATCFPALSGDYIVFSRGYRFPPLTDTWH